VNRQGPTAPTASSIKPRPPVASPRVPPQPRRAHVSDLPHAWWARGEGHFDRINRINRMIDGDSWRVTFSKPGRSTAQTGVPGVPGVAGIPAPSETTSAQPCPAHRRATRPRPPAAPRGRPKSRMSPLCPSVVKSCVSVMNWVRVLVSAASSVIRTETASNCIPLTTRTSYPGTQRTAKPPPVHLSTTHLSRPKAAGWTRRASGGGDGAAYAAFWLNRAPTHATIWLAVGFATLYPHYPLLACLLGTVPARRNDRHVVCFFD
jgi:hypothetical protein